VPDARTLATQAGMTNKWLAEKTPRLPDSLIYTLTVSHSGTVCFLGTASSILVTFALRVEMFFFDILDSTIDNASSWLNCVVKK
jgi:hypothetical protein